MRSFTGAVALLLAFAAAAAATGAQQRATQRIAGGRIAALAAHVAAALPADPDASLTAAFTVPDQTVSAGSLALLAHAAIVSSSYVNIPVEVDVDGRQDRIVYVGYRVVRYVRTAVATHDLVPGAVLESTDLTMARVPYVGHRANGTDVLVGRRVPFALAKGQPVYIEQTQAEQIVKPGSTVILVLRDGSVVLVADVVARSGGALGDQVMVYNPSTSKTLSGTVTGPNRVELDIEGVQ